MQDNGFLDKMIADLRKKTTKQEAEDYLKSQLSPAQSENPLAAQKHKFFFRQGGVYIAVAANRRYFFIAQFFGNRVGVKIVFSVPKKKYRVRLGV